MMKKRTLVTVVLACACILVGIILLQHYWSIHGSDLVNEHRVDKARGSRLLSFVDKQQGWMVGFGSNVYHTRNGGKNWKKQ